MSTLETYDRDELAAGRNKSYACTPRVPYPTFFATVFNPEHICTLIKEIF